MGYPTLKEEKKLWQNGYKVVACIDEVGRGPLAGPVVACATTVLQIPNAKLQMSKLRDSKQLTPKKREEFYRTFMNHPAIEWGIGRVSPQVIDRINILQATKLAMRKALQNLECKLQSSLFNGREKDSIVDFLILDGNMSIDVPISQKSIVKGDEKVFSCAAASIIAKVKRDRLMVRYHKKYPHYGFHKHKGYGTRLHFRAIKKHGLCPLHRKSFL
jgi:ribonuclease HII